VKYTTSDKLHEIPGKSESVKNNPPSLGDNSLETERATQLSLVNKS
jgi:hypothetical protein